MDKRDMSFCPLRMGHIRHIFLIFFENTLNILEYTQICLKISLSDGREAYGTDKLDKQFGKTFRQMNNHDSNQRSNIPKHSKV
jgi:hypothetical protein